MRSGIRALLSFLENNFWFVLICAVLSALLFPVFGKDLFPFLRYLLMFVLFMVFLDNKPLEILSNLKNWRLLLYLSIMNLLVAPVIFYAVSRPFGEDIALATLLLVAMPAGMATPALTGLLQGDTALAVSLTLCTSLLSPLTIPFVMSQIGQTSIELAVTEMFTSIFIILFVPMLAARAFSYLLPKTSKHLEFFRPTINISLIFLLIYGALASQQKIITESMVDYLGVIILLYAVFILLHLFGYFQVPQAMKETKVAAAVSLTYMNNALAILLAAEFFSSEVLIIVTLSELPWATLLGPFNRVLMKAD